mmetsp:Transcript_55062/g.131216  ORF Transcript_55062/g.131216 Transcript_55062/m.131216 type:complete len:324 (+) Transcript_55062:53-1024(+)|eukprot:CAMPEP_0178414840 /NCGR_PEP_ID=MMETSP0689_2-20121128/23242_1 /TAXON_ID=160604 /ORGANISM="Amphidinium massartii, Strain CS-259" /LENGTH=323 /DNA_ID=CAMNT_0020036139 /DNA_START=49 /DNA_END=1020 /DNA_ORIENTATION=-
MTSFVRPQSTAREWIGAEDGKFPAEPNRYHLYVGKNCPWCHRVLIARAVLGLQDSITVDVAFPNRTDDDHPRGANWWQFRPEGYKTNNGRMTKFPDLTADTVNGKELVIEIYEMCGIDQKSVPVLFDKKTGQIVSNESSEIVRMFGNHAKALGGNNVVLYPEDKQKEMDEFLAWSYEKINNGAYRAGFSGSQDTYEEAYAAYFAALDEINARLEKAGPFIFGDQFTEADLRLMPTLFRHDPVYYNRFKLSKKFLWEYPAIWTWMNAMYKQPGIEETCDRLMLLHSVQGYYGRTGNGSVPVLNEEYPDCYKNPLPAVPSVKRPF